MPCSPQSKIAPKPLFHNKPETTGSASFKVGDRLDLYLGLIIIIILMKIRKL